jgi:uncharacterized membrane protein YdjX (TVP38/TMEM64 family)
MPDATDGNLFEEGFGILCGAIGTEAGIAAGMTIAAVLGLGPFGLFVAVFICATAGGILLFEAAKKGGGTVYDVGNQFQGHIFYHIDTLLDEF